MRARQPDDEGFVDRDGVKIGYEVFGSGDPTIMLLPPWAIVQSRYWKAQVPALARHFRVITCDGRGSGRSDRPVGPSAYASREILRDVVAVLDATGTDAAVCVAMSRSCGQLLELAVHHPERVSGAVFIGPAVGIGDPLPGRSFSFKRPLASDEGWAKYNRHSWVRDWPGFLEFFMGRMYIEPHSTKPIEDAIGWGLETTPETIVDTELAPFLTESAADLASRVRCPCLVVHGSDDDLVSVTAGERLAAALGCELVLFEGSGHAPNVRDPVRFNLLLREFVDRVHGVHADPAVRSWTRARSRKPRALYLSSPIGLGHALRDIAIAGELRALRPDLQIDWLTQHPVTSVLERRGEAVHPASRWLASESAHLESESSGHDLHCFQAFRRMDEILVANFHVLQEVIAEGRYDLVVGDEAWDADHFWHDNPELKQAAFGWLTDFVGWLPMPAGGEREAYLTADYNAEMIEQVERYPRVRDRAIFIGDPDDIVPDRFGPGLPAIREWTREHYDFSGYVTGFDPTEVADRAALREQLGFHPDERVCVVTAGGSAVGAPLLRRVIASFPLARELVPDLRMVVVTGPRIDPASLPSYPGLDKRGYVDGLYRHLAACDLAVVQGGLTTCMELTALRRPFLYFPLRHHFEQNYHVRHRLERHGAGRCMDYYGCDPEVIAAAIASEIGREVAYRPVESDGAARAAALIAPLI